MALDEPRDDDEPTQHEGLPFLLSRELNGWLARGRSIYVDYDKWSKTFPTALFGARCG